MYFVSLICFSSNERLCVCGFGGEISSEWRMRKKERQILLQHQALSSNKSAYTWTGSKSRSPGSAICKLCDLDQIT